MESFRLKNIIILILALMNLFLLGSLYGRASAQQEAQDRIRQQLVELFSSDSARIALDSGTISFQTPPAGGTLTRDVANDQKVATLLLGEGLLRSDQGGGIYSYENSAGAAAFRSDGNFDVTLHLSDSADAGKLFRDFCKEFHYEEIDSANADGIFSASAVRAFSGHQVINSTVTFQTSENALYITGTYLPDTLSPADREDALSGPSALTAFLNTRREMGAVISAVTGMYPCYELQSTAAAPMTLTPAWCIETDAGNYYVNCYTGAVTRG